MKQLSIICIAAFAMLLSSTVFAQQAPQKPQVFEASGHVLPVLVAVDAKGDVTKVDSAIKLRSAQQKALESAVNKMITGPAKDKNGNPKSSQFVMMMAVDAGTNGQSTFKYVGGKPVQSGSVHWVSVGTKSHRRFALSPMNPGASLSSDTSAQVQAAQAYHASH